MRKRLKKKRRSCELCKPQRTGEANLWKPNDEAGLREFERGGPAGEAADYVVTKNEVLYRRLAGK